MNKNMPIYIVFENDPYELIAQYPDSTINADLQNAALSKKKRKLGEHSIILWIDEIGKYITKRSINGHCSSFTNFKSTAVSSFFTGPGGSGKTFVIKLIIEIYNRFTDNGGYCNAYITYTSTGKAAVAIDGTRVRTALKIPISKILPLPFETLHLYRSLFRYVKVLMIDEISMISAELLGKICYAFKTDYRKR